MRIIPEESKIVWDRDDFVAGYSPISQSAPADGQANRFNQTGAANMSNIDPFRTNPPGILWPGADTVATTGTTGSVFQSAMADDATTFVYMLGTSFNRYDVSVEELSTTGGFPYSITPTAASGVLGQTVVHYTGSTSTTAVLYSYNYGTAGNVGAYYPNSGTFDDDFMSTVPTSGAVLGTASHPMLTTSDDLVLIGDRDKVHSFRASTQTMSTNVLNLPVKYETVGFVEDEIGYDTWVFATTARATDRRGRAKAFVWSVDRPASYYKSPPIPDDECAAPFYFMGTVGCFTRSRSSGSRSVLRLYENGRWVPKYYFTGPLPVIDGVEIQNNTVVFNTGGEIHQWGPYAEAWPAAGFHIATVSSGSSGFIKAIGINSSTTSIYLSGDTTRIRKLANFTDTATWIGMAAKPDLPLKKKMRVTAVQLHMMGGATTRDLSLSLLTETFSGNISVFSAVSGAATNDTVRAYLQENFETRDDTPTVSFAPSLTWASGSGSTSAPGVERIEVFYELVDFIQS